MKKRKAPPKPRRLTSAERRELDALAAQILAGDAEAIERNIMRALYSAPTEIDVDPLPRPAPYRGRL